MKKIENLLKEIDIIDKKYDTIAKSTGANFNIFDTLNTTLETDICRVFYAFLNPQGQHNQGSVFLESFFDIVLKEIKIDKSELAQANIWRELTIDNGRKIDIYIETANWAIPIEVKIFAPDQNSQCYDYLKFASRQKKNYVIYYLTPDGREPAKESIYKYGNSIEPQFIKLASFGNDVLKWLEICVCQHALRLSPIREILLQFIAVIRRFSNKQEDNIMKDIIKVLMSSPDNMKAAQTISDNVSECKHEIMRKFFEALEKQVSSIKLNNKYDWNYSGKDAVCNVSNYPKKAVKPGISYHLKDFKSGGKNISVWVRCEIEWLLYVGFCVTIDEVKGDNKSKVIDINDLIKCKVQTKEETEHDNFTEEWFKNDWWLYWEYICAQNGEEIDFFNANPAYYSLFDNEKFESIVQKSSDKINEFLSRR